MDEFKDEFKVLAYDTLERFKYGGILAGDYVDIVSTEVEGGNEAYNDELKRFKESGLNIRVSGVTSKASDNSDEGTPDMFVATLGLELASGIYDSKITVPVKNIKTVSYNVPDKVPDQYKDKREVDRDGEPETRKSLM